MYRYEFNSTKEATSKMNRNLTMIDTNPKLHLCLKISNEKWSFQYK